MGAEFVRSLEQAVVLISELSEAFPEIASGTRGVLLGRFPYALYYQPDLDVIDVIQTRNRMTEAVSGTTQQTPWHLWLVGVLGVLWNSVGALDYFMTQTRNESYMGSFAPEQLESLYGLPAWLVGLWALAVWGGVLGALLVLLRKSLAVPVLLVSLLAMTATAIHNTLSTDGLYATGGTAPGFVLLIFFVALGLWLYARAMGERGVMV